METQTEKNPWTSALHHAENYASMKVQLYKYELIEKAAHVGASVTGAMINGIVLFVGIFMLVLGGAFAIGEYTGHLYLGFACAGLFFVLAFLIMRASRHAMKRKIVNFYIQKAFEHEEQN